MNRQIDVLFVHPGAAEIIYQDLSKDFSSIEPPYWSLLLAESCRSKGYGVAILDCDAERLNYQQSVDRIKDCNPRLVLFTVYGQNVNAGTTKMTGAVAVARLLKLTYPEYKIGFVGSHTSALPREVLLYPFVDFVLLNEGVYALHNLLKTDLTTDLQNVKGIGWKNNDDLVLNEPQGLVPQERLDIDLPGYSWDLLNYKNKPFDLYRSCDWHVNYIDELRTPYAAIYTSLGCRFRCTFCMVNILNRVNNDDNITAADSNVMRYWSPNHMIKIIDELVLKYDIRTLRFVDEMFYLNKKYYEPLLKLIIERGYGDKIINWSYARCDSVNDRYLELFKKSGMNYLALGIESSQQEIRQEVSKGSFQNINVRDVVKKIQNAGINVGANFIVGLSGSKYEDMEKTLELALELNTEFMNVYSATCLPGSPLYLEAKQKGWALPETFSGYSFHSYDHLPARTEYLTSREILAFRDYFWKTYFTNPNFLSMIENKFGTKAKEHINRLSKIKLRRKLLETNETL